MGRFDAMTTNERLVEAGLLNAFEAAISRGDRDEMIALLGRVDMADQAAGVADHTLANEARKDG